jgi:hypothetical protein
MKGPVGPKFCLSILIIMTDHMHQMFQSVSAYENVLLAAYSTSPIFVYHFSSLFVYLI